MVNYDIFGKPSIHFQEMKRYLFHSAMILKASIEKCSLDVVPVGLGDPGSRHLSHIFRVLRATLNNKHYRLEISATKNNNET